MFCHYINGRLIPGKGKCNEVINPATEENVGIVQGVDSNQANEALEAAQKAFTCWSSLSLNQRGEWILKLVDAIEEDKEKLLDLLMVETGKPLVNASFDYSRLVDCLKFFLEEAKRLTGSIIPDYDDKVKNLIIRQPLGVVMGYLAWNYPLLNVGYKLAPSLASGCTCVIKPSTITPLATLYLGEIAERIKFPEGVINIISGSSDEIGKTLNESNIPKMITLIGSTGAGKTIIKQSATSVKRYSLELGGNAPVIVMADADVKKAAELLINFKYTNSGQTCISPNRVYVHESVRKDFLNYAKGFAEQIKIGWGREPGAQMGPMITKEAQERMFALIEDATGKGAKLMYGGKIPRDKKKGYYFLPTILDGVTNTMRVYREEIFGPIMPILTFNEKQEVIRDANNTECGLAALLFSNNLKDVFEISEALDFGTVCVNRPFWNVNLPHGGIKESGVGKDCSVYSLEEYYYIKRISITL